MGNQNQSAEVEKIYARINKMAYYGKSYVMQYGEYFDEVVKNGKLTQMKLCLEKYYGMDTVRYPSLLSLKNASWDFILKGTAEYFSSILKTMMDSKGVYRIGNEIRSNSYLMSVIELSPTLEAGMQIVATSSKISIDSTPHGMLLSVLDSNVSGIRISNSTWGTYSVTASAASLIEEISAGYRYDTVSISSSGLRSIPSLGLRTATMSVSDVSLTGVNMLEVALDIDQSDVAKLDINLASPNGNIINVKNSSVTSGTHSDYADIRFTTLETYPKLTGLTMSGTGGRYQMDKYGGVGTQSFLSNVSTISPMVSGGVNGVWSIGIYNGGATQGYLSRFALTIGAKKMNDYLQQSEYLTQIPMLQGGTYQIEVETRNPYGKYYYRLSVSRDDLLGTVSEVTIDNYLLWKYYYRDKKFADLMGYSMVFVEASKVGGQTMSFMSIDESVSEEMNLYMRYSQAIDYLIS
jgi:hypothetical protein